MGKPAALQLTIPCLIGTILFACSSPTIVPGDYTLSASWVGEPGQEPPRG